MIIAATRMHRALVDFASVSSDMYGTLCFLSFFPAQYGRCRFRAHEKVKVSRLASPNTKQTDAAPTTPHRIEIAVDTAFEQHPTAQIADGDSSDINIGEPVSWIVGFE